MAICGDVLHSRVARSNIHLLTTMGSRVRVVGPPTLMPAEAERLGVEVFHDMERGLAGADIVMMLRLQRERMQRGLVPSAREFFRFFGLDAAKLAFAKPDALVMHPGPMNRGVEIDSAVADDPQRSVIREQVEMGVAVRMAVLDTLSRGPAGTPNESSDTLFTGVRLLDPASGLDQHGRPAGPRRADRRFRPGLGRPDGAAVVAEDGAILCPGLVDMRAALGEPGYEYRETIASAAEAAAAGGITTLAALPDTLPAIDDPALVRLLRARGEETGSLTILPYGAVTTGCRGEELAELGLLREAGAVAFTDGSRAIGSARLMRLALSYARGFGARIVQHPEDPSLADGGAATEGELATRLGLPGIPAAAEAILVARDIRLAALTGGAVHFAHVSTAEALRADPPGEGRRASP